MFHPDASLVWPHTFLLLFYIKGITDDELDFAFIVISSNGRKCYNSQWRNATNQSHGGLNLLKLKYRFGYSVESLYNFNFACFLNILDDYDQSQFIFNNSPT